MTLGRCSIGVSHKWHSRPCARNAVIIIDGRGFCKQHSPNSSENEKQEIRNAMSDYDYCMRVCGPTFFNALMKILQGDNDPRETARIAVESIIGKARP